VRVVTGMEKSVPYQQMAAVLVALIYLILGLDVTPVAAASIAIVPGERDGQ